MKKHLVLFSFFFLLFSFVFGACKHPAQAAGNPAAIGYGRISVQLEPLTDTSARTVFPPLVFDKYVYTFTTAGKTPIEKSPDGGGYFTLEVGEYTVSVSAYMGAGEPYTLAASGVSAAFTVAQGDNDPVVVHLTAVTAGLGEFSYCITYPPDAWADIALYSYPDMGDMGLAPDHVCDDNGLTECLELEAGTYLLTVQLSMNGRTAGISEAIHIVPFLTTFYEKEFVDEDFLRPTAPPVLGNVTVEYYWIDQHDSLVTTNGSAVHLALDETLAITAQGTGYTVKQWHLNGVSTDTSGNTYYFSSDTAGQHTVGLFVEKNGKLYNSNIVITVEGEEDTAEPQGGEPQGGHVTRTVTVDMYDSLGDGWNGSSALKINVNGITIANNVKVAITNSQNTPAGQRYTNTYTFSVSTGDVVQFFWVSGNSQGDNSFIVYYTGTPPIPAFCTDNKGALSWSGDNALLYRIRGNAPAGLVIVADGTLLGSFTVE